MRKGCQDVPIKEVRAVKKKRKEKDRVQQSIQQLAPRARECERETWSFVERNNRDH